MKKSREEAGFTQESVSRHFEWHSAKVTRIENARVPVNARDVNDLLTLYGVSDPAYREALLALARQSKQRTWWTDYRDVMRPGNFVGMEADASITRVWEPIVLPGLLQCEDYMRALIGIGRRNDTRESIERRVSLRRLRQERLTAASPLQLVALFDESVIHRVVGGPAVMQEQYRKIIDVAALPNVSVRIVPFTAGEHPFMGGPITFLEFPDVAHLDVIYLEGLAGDYYEEQPAEVKRYRDEFERLETKALSEASTVRLIERLLA
ncbi:helix-turn-helix transcriptional regulator [Dactylosporangium sp. NPDC006015]|uniref:helix-turn-helix domain-containing protein n=1 Tax=Dactylosporangium sp. NPDC006015 TaxID=3154576 RepID=UPI0033A6032B